MSWEEVLAKVVDVAGFSSLLRVDTADLTHSLKTETDNWEAAETARVERVTVATESGKAPKAKDLIAAPQPTMDAIVVKAQIRRLKELHVIWYLTNFFFQTKNLVMFFYY